MSQKFIKAFIASQFNAMKTANAKDRLPYMVAGVKDGRFYSLNGTDFGEAVGFEDVEFITEADGALTRITSSKVEKMEAIFKTTFGDDEDYAELGDEDENEEVVTESKDSEEKTEDTQEDAAEETVSEFDTIMTLITDGKAKKAKKLMKASESLSEKEIKKIKKALKAGE